MQLESTKDYRLRYTLVKSHCRYVLFQLMTDLEVGRAMDRVLKWGIEHSPQWMYQFNFNSWNNWLPDWMGAFMG